MGAQYDVVDNNGQTPVFYAIKCNKADMVEYLLKKGINLEIKDNKGTSLVQEANRRKRPQIVEMLIKHGAPVVEEEKKEKVPKTKPKVV